MGNTVACYHFPMPPSSWSKSANFFEATAHAGAGLLTVVKQERNTRIIVSMAGAAVLAGFWLRLPLLELALIIFMSASVLAAEMFNTAVEAISDLVWPEYREAVKVAKDLCAGAVLLLSLAAAVVGVLLFLPPLLRLFLR